MAYAGPPKSVSDYDAMKFRKPILNPTMTLQTNKRPHFFLQVIPTRNCLITCCEKWNKLFTIGISKHPSGLSNYLQRPAVWVKRTPQILNNNVPINHNMSHHLGCV